MTIDPTHWWAQQVHSEIRELVAAEAQFQDPIPHLEWDSLGLIITATNIKERWDIELDLEAVLRTRTLHELSELVIAARSAIPVSRHLPGDKRAIAEKRI